MRVKWGRLAKGGEGEDTAEKGSSRITPPIQPNPIQHNAARTTQRAVSVHRKILIVPEATK